MAEKRVDQVVVEYLYEASWDLGDELDAPRHARHLTADTLIAWGIDGFSDGAQLVVSELVTNALRKRRGGGPKGGQAADVARQAQSEDPALTASASDVTAPPP